MSLPAFLYDASRLRIILILVAAVCASLAYILQRIRARKSGEAAGPVILLKLDKTSPPIIEKPVASTIPSQEIASPPAAPQETAALSAPAQMTAPPPAALEAAPPPAAPEPLREPAQIQEPAALPSPTYAIQTVPSRPSLLMDLLRVALVVLTFVVAAGLILIFLSESSVDRMSQSLQSRSGAAPKQELIALLYLGDEIKDNDFHVRGVVRNITTQPVEKLDASIRLYGSDQSLLETAIVRMDKESIAPDETAEFHLVYPNYNMQFASYAVEFKLRQDDYVPYKDMRASRTQQ